MRKTNKNNNEKIAYKFVIYPDSCQKEMFAKTFGCCRKLWNVMLSDHNFFYSQMGEYLHVTPADYKDLDEYKYLNEVDSLALCNVQMNLDLAFSKFFNKETGYPKFKSKNKKQSYTTNCVSNNIRLEEKDGTNYIKLPKIGLVKINLHRTMKKGKIKNVTVSYKNNKYYASIMVELDKIPDTISKIDTTRINALDYKSNGLYQDKNGICNMPNWYKKSEKKLARAQRRLSKRTKGSSNYNKQKQRLSKIHAKISNQRIDFLQKDSTKITNLYDVIVVESINLKAISSKKSKYHLGKATANNAYAMYIRMIEYKLIRKGGLLIKADRFFASTQLCSVCGFKNPATKDLSVREWTCPNCGHVHDRDANAVSNLYKYGIEYLTKSGFDLY